jgi:hypothetical protein
VWTANGGGGAVEVQGACVREAMRRTVHQPAGVHATYGNLILSRAASSLPIAGRHMSDVPDGCVMADWGLESAGDDPCEWEGVDCVDCESTLVLSISYIWEL